MPESTPNVTVTRFGVFEVDLQAGELRKSGLRIKLQDQPFQILALLLERPGQVVTREDLRQRLWPADTFVDFDHSLNSAVKKLRQALGDDSDNPRFVETLPRRGYRLIAPVENVAPPAGPLAQQVPVVYATTARRTYFGAVILGAVVVAVAGLALWQAAIRPRRAPKVLRFTQLTNDGQAKIGYLATDGSRIYFNEMLPGQRTVMLQVSIKGGEAVPFSLQLKQPNVLDISRDGTELLVAGDDGISPCPLWVLPVAGGSPRPVGTIRAVEAQFEPGGSSIIYSTGSKEVYAVNRDGSSPRKLLTADNSPFAFRFSPDGRVFRFTQWDAAIDSMAVMEAAADGTGLRKMFLGCCGNWTPDGRFFIFQNRIDLNRLDIWASPEEKRFPWWKRDDKAFQLTAGPVSFQNPLPSKDGKQIFAIGGSPRAEIVRYDAPSAQFVPYLSGISAEGLAFSSDGQWVTYTSFPDGALWRSKVDGTQRRQLTFPPLRVLLPRWSPDGKRIAFNGILPEATWNIYVISSDGGTPDRVLPSEESQMDANWSPDGNSLIFGNFSGISNTPIYSVDLKSRLASTLAGSVGVFSPRWSPDGKYIAAITTDTLKMMLFEVATQKWTEAFGSEIGYLLWSHDGKYIYFQDMHKSERIVRLRLSDRKIENIADIKGVGRLTAGTFVDWFGLAPDDSPLFARDISTSEIYALEMEWP